VKLRVGLVTAGSVHQLGEFGGQRLNLLLRDCGYRSFGICEKILETSEQKSRSKNLENRPHRRAQIPRLTCRAAGLNFAKASSQQNAREEAKLGRARGSKEGPPCRISRAAVADQTLRKLNENAKGPGRVVQAAFFQAN
jgi:hypothetical protein